MEAPEREDGRGLGGVLVGSGVVLVATQIAISRLSHAFVWGEGHAERPILAFLAWEAVAFVAYFLAVEAIRRGRSGAAPVAWIVVVGAACRFALWSSAFVQEVDPYRYVWDGQAVLQGANPYVLAPAEAAASSAAPAGALGAAGAAVLERINYPEVPTIYPPLAQALFAGSQAFTPWGLGGWRALVLLAEIASVVVLAVALRRARRPVAWIVVYAWSPLILKELANSLHLDAFAVLGLSIFLLAVVADRPGLGGAALAGTTLVKVFAIALLPLLAAFEGRRGSGRVARVGATFVVLVILAYLPWIGAGGEVFDGLFAFARRWQRNDSLFTMVSMVAGGAARVICGLAIAGCVAGAAVAIARKPTSDRMISASLFVVVAIFLLSPTSNPWYFTWAVPFLAFRPSRALLLLSGTVLLYYADFYFLYRDEPGRFDLVRLVEYVPVYAWLAVELWGLRGADPRRRVPGRP